MFERRLKILLSGLVLLTVALMARAVVVQVVRHDYWTHRAAGLLEQRDTTETTRGQILDRNGVVMADDQPCTDAAVDFRAIVSPPDPDWVADISADRLRARLGPDAWKRTPRAIRRQMVVDEGAHTRADIDLMWGKLVDCYAAQDDSAAVDPKVAIADLRTGIIQKVELQRRWLWYTNFQDSQKKADDAPGWQRWLAGGNGPDIDRFVVEVNDQKRPHVILPAINQRTANSLGKRLEQFPGLVLQPSVHRGYPLQSTACHLLGRMSRVDRDDILNSRKLDTSLRQYEPNDLIGREGVEALCEPLLRGTRGEIERRSGSDDVISQTPFVRGQPVRITIDAELQEEVQDLFRQFTVPYREVGKPAASLTLHNMHGAAVVLDVPTGQVLALVSSPGFNLDELDAHYREMATDRLNTPLRNRATSDQLEPGSTVKPIIGLAGVTEGVIRPEEGIECTGDLYLPVIDDHNKFTDRRQKQIGGRCWVASEFGAYLRSLGEEPTHHIVPNYDRHRGHDGNPDGWLTFCDALERSCNIFFETTADRLGPVRVNQWYERFGFGRKTGIGIGELTGRRPDQFPGRMVMRRMTNCFAGIGQGQVWATPLQIANEAATIARGGIWMRPRLLDDRQQAALDHAGPSASPTIPDRVDLHLSPEGLDQARIGMMAVVNAPAGTGRSLLYPDAGTSGDVRSEAPDPKFDGITLAAKTGTAQAAPLRIDVRDTRGGVVIDPLTGRPKRVALTPSTVDAGESAQTPWYWSSSADGTQFVHAWFMGYAPVEKPQIAFAVLVEYSPVGGGTASGSIARQILERCVDRGYLRPARPLTTASR